MKCQRTVFCALLVAVGVLTAIALAVEPAEAGELGDNAALKYWKAFSTLPQLDQDDGQLLRSSSESPLSGRARKIVERAEPSLRLLHKGASIESCDWGHDFNEGAELLLPHCGKSRELARWAALRARVRLADGDADGANDDLLATIWLAHHCSAGGTFIEILVGCSIRETAVDVAASHVAVMTPPQRAQLAADLRELPPPTSSVVGLRTEKSVGHAWFARLLRAGEFGRVARVFSADLDKDPEAKLVAEALKDPETLKRVLERSAAALDRIIRDAGLPYAESMQKLEAFEKEIDQKRAKLSENPQANLADVLVCATMPRASGLRAIEAKAVIRQSMLLAALAYANDGSDAAAKVTDPIAGKPFRITPVEGKAGWIELASTVTRDGKPITLRARIQ